MSALLQVDLPAFAVHCARHESARWQLDARLAHRLRRRDATTIGTRAGLSAKRMNLNGKDRGFSNRGAARPQRRAPRASTLPQLKGQCTLGAAPLHLTWRRTPAYTTHKHTPISTQIARAHTSLTERCSATVRIGGRTTTLATHMCWRIYKLQ
ncbi:hypothetical protein EVAR_31036_1 [Eumeta japonica]|uniref:Uncharacterized protein n=1 Tax=Eumeta variegata TaxID=151549 RepID=A0A4C1VD12_EUMVA|nr:hypothetical protein EVAR_31036_1 [Eumeta japonica]